MSPAWVGGDDPLWRGPWLGRRTRPYALAAATNPPGPKNLYTLPAAGAEMQEIAWTALCAGGALLLLSLWAATQYVAHQLSDQRALDPPLYVVAGYRLYAPTQIVVWWWAYYRHAEAKPVFDRAAYIVIAGSCLSVTVAAVIAWRRSRRLDARTDLHGSAHWATPREVRRTGLLGGNGGVYVGAWRHPRSGRVHNQRHDSPKQKQAKRRRARARASGWSYPPCSPGRTRYWYTTSRARTGRSARAGDVRGSRVCALSSIPPPRTARRSDSIRSRRCASALTWM